MDARLRELERRLKEGDPSAALPYERHKRHTEGPRQLIREHPAHVLRIDAQRMDGNLVLDLISNQEILVRNQQEPAETGGLEDIPFYINHIPHTIHIRYHDFSLPNAPSLPQVLVGSYAPLEELYYQSRIQVMKDLNGWLPSSVENFQSSVQDAKNLSYHWETYAFLRGHYDTQPNIYIRRMDMPFGHGPTENARRKIMNLTRNLVETWPQEHPREMREAQLVHINNEIIAEFQAAEEIQAQYEATMNRLAALITEELP